MGYGMELKNNELSYRSIENYVVNYYKESKRECHLVGSIDVKKNQFFGSTVATLKFFVPPNLRLWIYLSTGGRDEICNLSYSLDSEEKSQSTFDLLNRIGHENLYVDSPTIATIEANLNILDDYL
jgi:hypothetical protein